MQIVIRECKCGDTNLQHSRKHIAGFEWTKEASCNVCDCPDYVEKEPDADE